MAHLERLQVAGAQVIDEQLQAVAVPLDGLGGAVGPHIGHEPLDEADDVGWRGLRRLLRLRGRRGMGSD